MAALNRLCPEPDDFSGAATAGATLPFLPTLVVAALLGVGALCWESTEPVPQPSGPATVAFVSPPLLPQIARMDTDSSHTATVAAPRMAAALAFASTFPMILEAPAATVARAEPHPFLRAARISPPHSGCPGHRCKDDVVQTASTPLRRPHVAAARASVPPAARPFALAGSEADAVEVALHDRELPDRALPFAPTLAPTIRALQRTAGFVGAQAAFLGTEAAAIGTEAVALCDAVTGLVGGMR